MGPIGQLKQAGEAIVRHSHQLLNRRGRSAVRVRCVGEDSLPWVEVFEAWGASVEVLAVGDLGGRVSKIKHLVSQVPLVSFRQAFILPPLRHQWHGVVAATIHDKLAADHVRDLFLAWLPAVTILALPGELSRTQVGRLLPQLPVGYHQKSFAPRHHKIGGVTTSRWHVIHITRLKDRVSYPSVMTLESYPRPLQTSLDDTAGRTSRQYRIELSTPSSESYDQVKKLMIIPGNSHPTPLVDSNGLAPDLSLLDDASLYFWVRAESVLSNKKVIRQVSVSELYAIWDYEGKLATSRWLDVQVDKVLRMRLKSPPAKMLRVFAYAASEAVRDLFYENTIATRPPGTSITVGLTRDIAFSPMEERVETRVAAAQADDAEVDLSNWAMPNETPEQAAARNVLRRLVVRWWADFKTKQAWTWWRENGKRPEDKEAIEDIVRRFKPCSYWQWHRGSRILFYLYPEEFQVDMRDGVEFFHKSPPPSGFPHNIPSPSREAEIQARQKVFKLRYRWYLEYEFVRLVTARFSVVKVMTDGVVTDIRVVWNSKSNGHNGTLWAPGFILDDFGDVLEKVFKWIAYSVAVYLELGCPTQDYTLPSATFIKSKSGDIDIAEMFTNWMCHPKERPYLGVRMFETRGGGRYEPQTLWRYCRMHFGGLPSPYNCVQGQRRTLEVAKGDRHDPTNHWQWDRVRLNLPGAKSYDPSLPRVLLLRKDGRLATQEADYVDDIHASSRELDGENECAKACSQLKSEVNSRGNQADERKYRPPSTTPGAWTGLILHTDTPFPMKSTTQKKWTRFKDGLAWISRYAEGEDCTIDTAELRRIAGLGVNVTEVYADARPYLKGMFNAIEAFRSDRDPNGWRLQSLMDDAHLLEHEDATRQSAQADYPERTPITQELLAHVRALSILFKADTPLELPIRPTDSGKIRYFLGDASAEGFGSGTQFPNLEVRQKDGLWDPDFAEGGSNLREATAQANHLLTEIRAGLHDGCELWMGTDNAVWSYVWTKGMSTAKHLFDLALELKIVAREHEVYIHSVHISGDRMIASGIDGWSRGNYDLGVSLGYDIRDFLPLHLSAWEVAGDALELWCRSWMDQDYKPPLKPEGWFEEGHLPGVHIWAPPPAGGLIALKELARSRHKRPFVQTHVVMIPRLLYQEEWRSRFEKEVDLWFALSPGECWPHSAFEPLMVGLSFPLSRSLPWLVRLERERVVGIGRALSKMSKESNIRVGDYLRKLWRDPRALPSL